jgi:hypothetical protein
MNTLEQTIDNWYEEDSSRKERFEQIINGQAGFSLREIDHFVTNMTVRKPVIFLNPKNGKIVDVNSDYRDLLRCYHKFGFDSFNRVGGHYLKQKNFFRWAMENGIVDYVSQHVREIEADMAEMRRLAPEAKKQRVAGTSFTFIERAKSIEVPRNTNIVF